MLRKVAPVLILLAVVLAVYHPVLGLGLLGHDTYPILLTARVEGPGDLADTFTEKLMDERYFSDFWRPLLNLSVALDHALWGLDGTGYQVTSLLCFAAAAWMVLLLAQRLLGPDARLGPWVAAGAFVLFPLHFQVLPVVSRRPESLGTFLSLLAIHLALSPRSLPGRRPPLLPGFVALLAMLAKETAILLAPLIFLAGWLHGPGIGGGARARQGLRVAAAPAAATVRVLAVRLAVIGGLGGHEDAGLSGARLGEMLRGLLFPVLDPVPPPGWALAAAFVLGLALTFRRIRHGRAVLLAAAWTLCMLVVHAYAGARAWYFVFPSAGFAILAAALLESWAGLLREKARPLVRAGAAAGLGGLAGILAWQAAYAPLFRSYPEWDFAETARAECLQELEARIAAFTGDTGRLGPVRMPVRVAGWQEGSAAAGLEGIAILSGYSVQAWAKLRFPERRIQAITLAPPPGIRRLEEVPLPPGEPEPGVLQVYLLETDLRLRFEEE